MSIHEDPWPEGTPSWVDLMVPDRHAARAFYGPLFGWEFVEGGPETGFYTTATIGGRSVAGFAEPMPGAASTPSTWTTYLAVDNDIVAVTGRARDAGAQVLFDPMTIMELGAMAVLVDPTGAVFGLWQPGSHTGADVVNEPGALIWNEIMTRDPVAAQTFYGAVFGFTFGDMSGPGFVYATIDLDGRTVAGKTDLKSTSGGSFKKGKCKPPKNMGLDWIFASKDIKTDAFVRDRNLMILRITDHPVLYSTVHFK